MLLYSALNKFSVPTIYQCKHLLFNSMTVAQFCISLHALGSCCGQGQLDVAPFARLQDCTLASCWAAAIRVTEYVVA